MAASIEEIVRRMELEGLIRTNKVSNNYYQIYCPFHNDGNERKPSCGILLSDIVKNGSKYPAGWTHCFTCGYAKPLKDVIADLIKIKPIPKTALDWFNENVPGLSSNYVDVEHLVPTDLMQKIDDKFIPNYKLPTILKPKVTYVPEEELVKYRFTVDYMYDRKLTDEIIEKFDVGFDANWIPEGRKNPVPCITFPVRDKTGNTLFLCRRSIQGKFFNYPTNVTKPVYGIYELPDNCDTVFICESCFNALTCWTYGKPAVALLGTGNDYQLQQLKTLGVKQFIIAMDPDAAGRRATKKLKNALKNVAITWELTGIPEGKDINDLTEYEFNSLEII